MPEDDNGSQLDLLAPAPEDSGQPFEDLTETLDPNDDPDDGVVTSDGQAVSEESQPVETPETHAGVDETTPWPVADALADAEALADGESALAPDDVDEDEELGQDAGGDVVLPELTFLKAAPSPAELIRSPRLSRLAGAALGGAIGDAMGHPTEFISSFSAIRARYGEPGVTGYELYWTRGDRRFAPYTDDTQMAEVVFRSLLLSERETLDLDATMRTMADGFIRWSRDPQGGHRAPGNACMAGCRALARGEHWSTAGGPRAGGCGSVMRAYPFGLVYAHDLSKAEHWAVAHSRLTHGDPIALGACAAMAVGMARILRDDPLDIVLSEMVAAACRYSPKTAEMMALAIHEAQEGTDPEVTLQRLQAWAAHEAIAAAVYILARHPDDPRAAILEGANTPGDSDSIATLAGALVGGRMGVAALPPDWIDDVERRDVFIQLACAIW